jgi:transketolase
MRNEFCQAMVAAAADESLVFLTGDLGYRALEPLRERMGRRFINAGVAEQNMVSVAAGLARAGLRPWAYSIAPFIYARPYEQIRNDVCFHGLPARLVGNGGGYGYGVMGATHHALEDYGALLGLPGLRVFVPAFSADVDAAVRRLGELPDPAYLRLGMAEDPAGVPLPAYAAWRRVCAGDGPTVVGVGPVIGPVIGAAAALDESVRPTVWVLAELPVARLPDALLADLRRSGHLVVVEEHVAQGGVGASLAHALLAAGAAPPRFTHHAALGYPSGRYGSQRFHRRECGLDAESIVAGLVAAARR